MKLLLTKDESPAKSQILPSGKEEVFLKAEHIQEYVSISKILLTQHQGKKWLFLRGTHDLVRPHWTMGRVPAVPLGILGSPTLFPESILLMRKAV